MLVIRDIMAHEGVEWLLSELRENLYKIALERYLWMDVLCYSFLSAGFILFFVCLLP